MQQEEQSYYTLDTALFEGTFPYFHNEPREVRGKAHVSEETYHLSLVDQLIEPMSVRRGTRTYIHLKPFVLLPNLRLTIGLYQTPAPDGVIGQVLGGNEMRRKKEIVIGQAQAWYYPAPDNTLILWECFLEPGMRGKVLAEDANMRALWEGFIRFLHGQFPGVTRVVSPAHEPIYENEEYQAFLTRLGFAPIEGAKSWGKQLVEE